MACKLKVVTIKYCRIEVFFIILHSKSMRENIPMIQGIDIGSRSCSPWVFSRLGVLEGQPQKHRHRSYQLVYLKSWLLLYSFWRKIKKRKRSSSIVLVSLKWLMGNNSLMYPFFPTKVSWYFSNCTITKTIPTWLNLLHESIDIIRIYEVFLISSTSFLRLRLIECLMMNGMKNVGREWCRIEWKGKKLPFHSSVILSWNKWFHPHALQIEGKGKEGFIPFHPVTSHSIPLHFIPFDQFKHSFRSTIFLYSS